MSKYDYEPVMHVFDCSNPYPIPGGQCDCIRGASEGCECLDDHCHEHHRCPPCPPCPPPYPYPPFPYPCPPCPTPPTPPTPPTTSACTLYLATSTGTTDIASGDEIILPLIRSTGTCLSYNALTGQITVLTSGTYYFDWNVNADSAGTGTDTGVVITLQQSTGTVLGISGATAFNTTATVLVSGSTVVSLTAGDIITLNNRTGEDISTVAVAGDVNFAASLTVVKVG